MYRVDLGKKLLDKEYNPFISLAAQYRSDEADKNGRDGFNLDDIYYICGGAGDAKEFKELIDKAVKNEMLTPFDEENELYNYNYNYSVNNNYFVLLGEEQTASFFDRFSFEWTIEYATQITTAYCCLAKMYNYQHDVKHRNYIFSMKNVCDMCYMPYNKKNRELAQEYVEWLANNGLIEYQPYKDEKHPYCKLFELTGLALNKR